MKLSFSEKKTLVDDLYMMMCDHYLTQQALWKAAGIPHTELLPESDTLDWYVRSLLWEGSDQHGVILDDVGAICGFVFITTTVSINNDVKTLSVDELYISPQYRNRGYGKAVMDCLKSIGEESGYAQITLNCAVNNQTAMQLYSGTGFKPAFTTMRYVIGETVN